MSGFSSCAALVAYADTNVIVMEMREREVLPVVKRRLSLLESTVLTQHDA